MAARASIRAVACRRPCADAGIEYDKVIAAHGSPIPFLRKGSRDDLRAATGDTRLPALKLPDGTVLTHSREILAWVAGVRPSGDDDTGRTAGAPASAEGAVPRLSHRRRG